MIAELHRQYDHVREQTEFLKLKEMEFRPNDQISLFGLMEARLQLKIEKYVSRGAHRDNREKGPLL